MLNIKADLFNRYVLRPLGLVYIVLSLTYFFYGERLIGAALAGLFFLMFIIGRGLNAVLEGLDDGSAGDAGPGHIEAVLINKAGFMVSCLIGTTAALLSWRHGLGWGYIILAAGSGCLLSSIIISAYSSYLVRAGSE